MHLVQVLIPTELGREMPVDRQRTVRVYWRDRGRVGPGAMSCHPIMLPLLTIIPRLAV